MKFYVIYTYDTTRDGDPENLSPRSSGWWQQTEDDSLYDYNYLAFESDHPNGSPYRNGHHRKYVGRLTKNQLIEFLRESGLTYEDISTMGSLTEIGWLPSMSFVNYYGQEDGIIDQRAYVSPILEPVRDLGTRLTSLIEGKNPGFWPLTKEEILDYWRRKEDKYWGWLGKAFSNMF